MQLKIKRKNNNVCIPKYQSDGASGLDLHAYFENNLEHVILPNSILVVGTGLHLAIPFGYEGQIRSRSGLATKHGITVLGSPSTIDSDYRGEVFVALYNNQDRVFIVEPNMRIAQLVIAKAVRCHLEEYELDETIRGEGGFGSTGLK